MIIFREDQISAIRNELSTAALKRLAKLGVQLSGEPELVIDCAAALDLPDETPVVDSDGYIWLATKPLPDEVWLCPFDDRMAYQIRSDGSFHVTHPTATPAFPLEILRILSQARS